MRILKTILALMILLLLPMVVAQVHDPLYASLDTLSGDQMLDLSVLSTELPQEAFPITLHYGGSAGFDENNDGIAAQNEVIDIEVAANTAPKNPACVRWEIYSVDALTSSAVCNGDESCCSNLRLAPSRYNWDASIFLTYGLYGATKTNIVSAQSVEFKDGSYAYSKWQSIDARFIEGVQADSSLAALGFEKLLAKHPSIKAVELLDETGVAIETLSQGEKADVLISVGDSPSSSGLGMQSLAKGTEVVFENVATENMEGLDSVGISTANAQLESSVENAGVSAVQLISVENALALGAEGGKVVFQKSAPFTTVLHCAGDDASSCSVLSPCTTLQENCYEETVSEVIVHIPHFSSVLLGIDNETLHLNITSPDNETILASGENVYLNMTSNITLLINYSLDGGSIKSLGNSTSFSVPLNGTLTSSVLSNGMHLVRLGILTQLGTNSTIKYPFIVNDTLAPSMTLNMSNNSAHTATYASLHLRVSSSEFGNVSYSLNGQSSVASAFNENKTALLFLNPQQGSNTLEINTSDAQGNVARSIYAFTFTELGSCTDGVQNGPETGIDCGGSCSPCIAFNASIDRQSYNLSDTAYITIISRANSVVNVTVKRGGMVSWRYEFRPAFSGFPIAETRAIGNTSQAGNYTINATTYYLNTSERKDLAFEVVAPYQSPMSVSISANTTTINENSEVKFSSSVSGSSGTVSYKWDLQNDGTIDSTLSNLTFRFQNNGTFIVNLTVSDSAGNQTDLETIISRKTYNLTIRAKDNSSGANIQNAIIEVGSYDTNTSSDGSAILTIPKGSYDIDVTHQDYRDSSGEIELNANQEYFANLSVADRIAPYIALISPQNATTAYNNSIDFAYTVYDASPSTCVLYTRANTVLWKATSSMYLPTPSGQYSFTLNNLELVPYEWKVECRDADGNYNATAPFSLTINPNLKPNELSIDLNAQDIDTEELEAIITQAMEDLKDLNGRDNEIAESIQLRKTLEKALTGVKRANRDLHSLEWRKLNETELEKETQAILDRVEEIKKTTPKKFTVLEAREFVSYASKPDVELVVQMLIDAANAKVSKKELAKLADENNKLQSLLTITTKASRIDLEYIEGGAKKHTVISKKVSSTTEDFVPYVYYEVIPKEVAKTTDDMNVFAEHTVVQKDPVLSFDLAKVKEYSYLIREDVPLQRTEGISSVLAFEQVEVKKVGLLGEITGFSVLGEVSRGLRDTIDIRLIVEVVIIAILVVVYLIYSIGSLEEIKRRFEPRDVKEFREKAEHAQHEIDGGAYERASAQYREVAMIYRSLDARKKEKLNAIVTQLLNEVNVLYIGKLLSEADGALMKKDRKEMAQIYAKIRVLYKIISREYKAQVLQKCMELHDQLSVKK